ncbi:hypothetical protein BU24DRAFT_386456 [Aaosphaeria arxii CBS 175.79]|uniref:Amino acid transporter transmembrane domain-containing protein n=1 Tax=Aaosphaeria arxii CBS 175.79 TaxID=1450172 RepID=A0A6A5Y2P1_9PLEO|nr:uncharacterized protein BU24DRAFT_386456 [Aaosphaeria arxii CBS 175.79]KAF2019519.1 hypothetical protein BU24DRAFT_386456 [Aaosphaeria arxii CBS 175.79]
MTKKGDLEAIERTPSHLQQGSAKNITNDAVFGEITADGPNYRSLGWIATAILMSKSMIGLGVLSIPAAFDVLGIIPGVLCLLAIGSLTSISAYVVGTFKMNHSEVYAIDDVGYKLFGVVGREFFGAAFIVYWTFVVGSGMLSVSIALNAISTHGACTAVFVVVAFAATFLVCSIRTLGRISFIAWAGLASILASILLVTIAVGVQDRPAAAPSSGPWKSDYKLFGGPKFLDAASAISSLVFAYAGTTTFFAIAAEMREPKHYAKSLTVCQILVNSTYVSIGIVVYYFCGSYVASPALGSAGPLLKKVAYGIGILGVFVSAVLLSHVTAKYIFVRLLRGTRHLTSNSPQHWLVWLSCTFGVTVVAYIIASAIPVFNSLVSLIGAFFGTLMSFQPFGMMWLYDNWKTDKSKRSIKWYLMCTWSFFVIVAGTFLMISGTWGSVLTIISDYSATGGSAAWSCADNSNSV